MAEKNRSQHFILKTLNRPDVERFMKSPLSQHVVEQIVKLKSTGKDKQAVQTKKPRKGALQLDLKPPL